MSSQDSRNNEKVVQISKEVTDKLMSFAAQNEFNMADVLLACEGQIALVLVILASQYSPNSPKLFVNAMMASLLVGVIRRAHEHLDIEGIDPEAEGIAIVPVSETPQ